MDGHDLSPVLQQLMRHANRVQAKYRLRLANSPLTRAFLDAGLALISTQLDAPERSDGDPAEDETKWPILSWLSRDKVLERTQEDAAQSKPTESKFRERWPSQTYFIEDLLAYSLWVQHWSGHISKAQDSLAGLSGEDDFAEAIHEVAYQDLRTIFDNPVYKVSLLAAAAGGHDPTVREAIAKTYEVVNEVWSEVYAKALEARGARLRPDVTTGDISDILAACAEGFAMRIIAEPTNARLIDHARHRSLLGKAALAIAAAAIDPGDGLSLEQLVSGVAPAGTA